MRRMLTALALVIASSAAAHAACKDEVESALERQRKSSGFRMETMMLSAEGRVNMTVDYALPDRMRQIVKSTADPTPVETVVVGNYAWSRRDGEGWTLLHPQLTNALVTQMRESIGDEAGAIGDFECLGKQPLAGKDMLAYQGENIDQRPESKSPAAKDQPKLPDRPVRVIYVDQITGLPMRSIFARADKLDKPIFEATYSYPADIKIEAPPPPPK